MSGNSSRGFTLSEIVIAIVMAQVLAAVAIPRFLSAEDRAREGQVKMNMHTLQVAVEDFAMQNDGTYPVAADAATVHALMPGGQSPINPFIGAPSTIVWAGAAVYQGSLGYAIPSSNAYVITGFGAENLLDFTLQNY